MKKAVSLVLALILCLSLVPAALAATTGAVRSAQNFTVDGKAIDCEKYNIGGNNYFKLRDIAYLLNVTKRQFSVGFDAASGTVSIETGKAYTAVGGELVIGADKSSTATPSAQTIQIDGKKITGISVYNIGGNNYFKLRDLGTCLGFDVDYDAATNTAIVNTEIAVGKSLKEIGSDGWVYEYTYDAKGNRLTEKCTNSNGDSWSSVYTYDEKGNRLTEKYTDSDGDSWSYVYTYGANGNMLTEKYTNSDGDNWSYVYTCDAKGNRLTEKGIDGDGYSYSAVYTYDAKGNRLTEKGTNSDGDNWSYVCTYDENGNMLTEKYTSSDGDNWYCVYIYDAKGNMLASKYTDRYGNVTVYE